MAGTDQLIVRLTPAPGIVGSPEVGRRLFVTAGCAGCHTHYGLPEAIGVAGPVLTNVVLRPTLAGEVIPMSPQTMTQWLIEPASLEPGTTMPGVGLTVEEAQHITAYLYSQPYNPRR
jgi:cytochrome c